VFSTGSGHLLQVPPGQQVEEGVQHRVRALAAGTTWTAGRRGCSAHLLQVPPGQQVPRAESDTLLHNALVATALSTGPKAMLLQVLNILASCTSLA
jgi:hypothetical protein